MRSVPRHEAPRPDGETHYLFDPPDVRTACGRVTGPTTETTHTGDHVTCTKCRDIVQGLRDYYHAYVWRVTRKRVRA